jgi:hypothetical protein
MKVKDLVKLLLDCDQEKTVFLWENHDISNIEEVDELTDRVDLHTYMEPRDRQIKNLIMEDV